MGYDFHRNPTIELEDLIRLEDPCVILEGQHIDSDGEMVFVFSIGGRLMGRDIAMADHQARTVRGALVGGDAIIVHARTLKEAQDIATEGLTTTIVSALMMDRDGSLAPDGMAGIISDVSRISS